MATRARLITQSTKNRPCLLLRKTVEPITPVFLALHSTVDIVVLTYLTESNNNSKRLEQQTYDIRKSNAPSVVTYDDFIIGLNGRLDCFPGYTMRYGPI